MMNHSLKNRYKVNPGTIIEGKWHKNRYVIVKELGFGANGIVYLARTHQQQVALKMSDNGISITSEVNVLKSFAKVQGSSLGPSLLDVDDWENNLGRISFYTMEYIEGPDLLSFISQKGQTWTQVLILQLLSDLEKLHQAGWVFGDLKPENLIVTGPPPKIRCIDVGGTTIQGRAIKEFTEFYDRGYWGLGSRKADPSYDLFAVAMIIINTAFPKRFNKTTGGIEQLKTMIRQKSELVKVESVLVKALTGGYSSAIQMRGELLALISGVDKNTDYITKKRVHSSKQKPKGNSGSSRSTNQKRKGGMLETVMIVAAILFFYFIYIYQQVL
jgi:serine/threonine protein kinase